MSRKKFVNVLTLGVFVVALALGAVAYVSARAATPTPAAGDNSAVMDKGFKGGGRGGLVGGFSNAELATALGISTTDLTAAYTKANETALAQAVSQGLITQAQADEIRANGSAFPLGDRWDGWLSQNGIDYDALLAEALGITVDKLQAAYVQAFDAHVDAAVTAGTLTQEQADLMKGQYALRNNAAFQSSMKTAYEAAVAQAVKDGVISQAQADLILENSTSHGFKALGGFPGGGDVPQSGLGGHGRRGGGPMSSGSARQDNSATPTSTP